MYPSLPGHRRSALTRSGVLRCGEKLLKGTGTPNDPGIYLGSSRGVFPGGLSATTLRGAARRPQWSFPSPVVAIALCEERMEVEGGGGEC